MKFKLFIFLAVFQFCAAQANAFNIFACEPEWASLAREIGGDKVEVFSATTAFQDAHYIQARPSLIANMRKADLVICSGAGLESGWLPILFQKTNKKDVIYAAQYVKTLDVPVKLDRSEGDVHPEGNPHIHLNPYNILKISDVILEKLLAIDSANRDFYEANHLSFNKKMNAKIKDWEKQASSLKGINVITKHKNFTYLFNWLGINNVGTLEPKPGVAPTSKHLSELVETAKSKDVKLIVYTPFEDEKAAKWLSDKTGVKYIQLPFTVEGNKKATDLFSLFDETISLIVEK